MGFGLVAFGARFAEGMKTADTVSNRNALIFWEKKYMLCIIWFLLLYFQTQKPGIVAILCHPCFKILAESAQSFSERHLLHEIFRCRKGIERVTGKGRGLMLPAALTEATLLQKISFSVVCGVQDNVMLTSSLGYCRDFSSHPGSGSFLFFTMSPLSREVPSPSCCSYAWGSKTELNKPRKHSF